MIKLDFPQYRRLFDQYKSNEFFFPLIGAVLTGQQKGNVYADSIEHPKQVFVEHGFGFAQIFGQPVDEFESDLKRYLLTEQLFSAPKVRLYGTYSPAFLASPDCDSMRSYRQRFMIDAECIHRSDVVKGENRGVRVGSVVESNVAVVEKTFGVVNRFWPSSDNFILKANAVLIYYRDQMAGICYAAAEADSRVEIDVLTLPEYRNLGVGKFAVSRFVENCFGSGLQPLWDCFTNNAGSMNLSRAVGFSAVNGPYPFFTINKHSQ